MWYCTFCGCDATTGHPCVVCGHNMTAMPEQGVSDEEVARRHAVSADTGSGSRDVGHQYLVGARSAVQGLHAA